MATQQPIHVGLFPPGHLEYVEPLLGGIHAFNPEWTVSTFVPQLLLRDMDRMVADFLARDFDGLIADADWDLWEPLRAPGRAVAWFFGRGEPDHRPVVRIDEHRVGRMGARFLIDQGFSRFAFLGAGPAWCLRRREGFVAELADAGFDCDSFPPEPAPGSASFFSATRPADIEPWLLSLPRPVAVMAAAGVMASALARTARTSGLGVPGDVAILSSEDAPVHCRHVSPGLSAVDLDLPRVGAEAAGLLAGLLAGRRSRREVTVSPSGIVPRPSTEYRPADELVGAALAYLRETPPEDASLAEMYDRMPASRRTVQRRFVAALGRTPSRELQRLRVVHARRLLRRTHLPLVDIAVRCGFEYVSNMCRSFKALAGVTPTAYRKGAGAAGGT